MTDGIKLTTQEMVDAVPPLSRVLGQNGGDWYVQRMVGDTLTHVATPAIEAQQDRRQELADAEALCHWAGVIEQMPVNIDNRTTILSVLRQTASKMEARADRRLPPALDVDEPEMVDPWALLEAILDMPTSGSEHMGAPFTRAAKALAAHRCDWCLDPTEPDEHADRLRRRVRDLIGDENAGAGS